MTPEIQAASRPPPNFSIRAPTNTKKHDEVPYLEGAARLSSLLTLFAAFGFGAESKIRGFPPWVHTQFGFFFFQCIIYSEKINLQTLILHNQDPLLFPKFPQ